MRSPNFSARLSDFTSSVTISLFVLSLCLVTLMSHPTLTVAENISFEEAITFTQTFLSLLETEELTESEIKTIITQLVQSENGARGFFVTYLTDQRPLGDRPSPGIITGLQTSPAVVSELLVKNIAMSTAMAITHHRNNNEAMGNSSQRVRSRSLNLSQQLQLSQIKEYAQHLYDSAKNGTGNYQSFLERWGYDDEQKQAIQTTLEEMLLS